MTMKIYHYSVSMPIHGVCKSPTVWVGGGVKLLPLFYIKRPKWIKDDDVWRNVVQSVQIGLPAGFEVE